MPTGVARILNEAGLHARPATSLVKCANEFEARITIATGDRTVDAKSVLEVLTLAAARGTELEFTTEGPDAEEALRALVDLVGRRFDVG
jgi:phosphotransferase system HPr (HPr) family protein